MGPDRRGPHRAPAMEHSPSTSDIEHTLGIDSTARHGRRLRRWLLLGALVVAALASVAVWRVSLRTQGPAFKTQAATQGALVVTVTATGTLQPINQVDVGSELSGIVQSVAVDYNARVKAGQVLARLDTAKQEAQVLQSQAAVRSADARVKDAEATVEETRLKLERMRMLVGTRAVSEQDLSAADAAHKRAVAQEAVARSDANKARAALNADEITLNKMAIRAPIAGIVLRRSVEPGQTVAASLQAPVLFTLADDLRRMQISVAVDEADVGKVQAGQGATFTVDAWPERAFPARVTEVRYAPQTVAGVVTYETLLAVDNSALLLRPGMTATAEITVASLADALLVPNAALRFTPPETALNGTRSGSGWMQSLLGRRQRPEQPAQRPPAEPKGGRRTVWTLRDGQPVSIRVQVGATDGQWTQVLSGEVTPGTPLLVDLEAAR